MDRLSGAPDGVRSASRMGAVEPRTGDNGSKMTRRRESPRVRVRSLSAGVKLKKSLLSSGRKKQVSVLDIGPRGMSFRHDQVEEPGTLCSFTVDFEPSVTVRGQGTVRNCRKAEQGFIVGVEFGRVSRPGRDWLGNSANLLRHAGTNVLEQEMPLGDKLSLLRRSLGLTIAETAAVSGVPPDTISRIESGLDKNPTDASVSLLARSLGIRPALLQPATATPAVRPRFEPRTRHA